MKLVFFILLSFSLTFLCAQSDSLNPEGLKITKGIYMSFAEVMAGEPSRNDSIVWKVLSDDDILRGTGKYTFKLASGDKAEYKKLRKALVGISDGEYFYLSDRHTVGGVAGLTRVISTGPYVIAPIQERASKYLGGGLIPYMIKVGHGFLVNLNRGISEPMTKSLLKSLLDRYPEIWAQYSGKVDWYDMAPEIVTKVNVVARQELAAKNGTE